MEQYADVIIDPQGNVVVGAMVSILDSQGAPAQIFGSNNQNSSINNPILTGSLGEFSFFARNGRYRIGNVSVGGRVFQAGYREIILNDPDDGTGGLPGRVGALESSVEQLDIEADAATQALDALQLPDYAALRAYKGPRKSVYVTGVLGTAAPSGIAGMFVRDDADTTSADNGGTLIVAGGKRFKRVFDGAVNVQWFGAKGYGGDDVSAAFQAAFAAAKTVIVPPGDYVASFDMGSGQRLIGSGSNFSSNSPTVLIAPSGAAHVIRIDATAGHVRYCTIRDLQIYNANSVPGCVGINFYSPGVTRESDYHALENLVVRNFETNIQVRGRQIYATYTRVRLLGEGMTNVNLDVSTDPSDVAFNVNKFDACSFMGAKFEGVRMVGPNVNVTFCGGTTFEGNNTSKTPGIAAVRLENTRNIQFDTCYFENNGYQMAVNNGALSSNGIDLHFTCGATDGVHYNPTVRNCWFYRAGICIWVGYDDTTGGTPNAFIRGGDISNCLLNPATGGYSFYCSSAKQAQSHPPITLDGSNSLLGKVVVIKDGNNQQAAAVRQINTTLQFYLSAGNKTVSGINSVIAVTPDGSGTDLEIDPLVAGQQFTFHNPTALALVINSSYFWNEAGIVANHTIPPRCSRSYIAEGTYGSGGGIKLFETGRVVRAASTPTRAVFNRGDVVENTLPSAGGFSRWVCNTAGGAAETTRANSTAYAVGVWASIGATVCECVAAGTSGASAPSTPTAIGQVVVDGGVSWKCRALNPAVFKTDTLST